MLKLCCCKSGNHKKGCGCMSDGFLRQARINFFCCLVHSGKDPDLFAECLRNLGRYHARNIHQWDGGNCDFHSLKNVHVKSVMMNLSVMARHTLLRIHSLVLSMH